MKKNVLNVFWTGGWDSSYRIIDLSFKEVVIQPIYLKDEFRLSEQLELQKINNLTKEIRELETTKCTILDLKILSVSDIHEDQAISSYYHEVYDNFYKDSDGVKLGSQYEWLARFSSKIDNIELGIEMGSKVIDVINSYGGLTKVYDEIIGDHYVLNKSISSEALISVFGNYRFPLLDVSKGAMKLDAKKRGFLNLLNKTWFCHIPLEDKPCGVCNPCKQVIEAGLTYRLDKNALKRYQSMKTGKPIRKNLLSRMAKKIKSLYR